MSADGSDEPPRLVPRIPTLAEQRRKIEKRCAERDRWPPTHIHSPSHREKTYKIVRKLAP